MVFSKLILNMIYSYLIASRIPLGRVEGTYVDEKDKNDQYRASHESLFQKTKATSHAKPQVEGTTHARSNFE